MVPLNWAEIANLHPFGHNRSRYETMLKRLEAHLASITGFQGCSLQPTSGAMGEYAGLLAIRKYQQSQGDGSSRKVCLVPRSAHGTNSASAVMMGLEVHWLEDEGGLETKEVERVLAEVGHGNLSCLMITYPSTFGVFDSNVKEVIALVKRHGGLVYMDGANMNAQLGLTGPGWIGADVCHLNLHKSFSLAHGGGGPGIGAICVAEHLVPFLPDSHNVGPVSSAPFGQAGACVVPYLFIEMLGSEGLRLSGMHAILNANYMMEVLKPHFQVRRVNEHGRCSHEFIIEVSEFKTDANVTEEDIAKRLMDFGFHAPTMSWPVHGSLMIEPTESEAKDEMDRFCEALIQIKTEIDQIKAGTWDRKDNPLKNAPHTQAMVCGDAWSHSYSRETAAFPLPFVAERGKFWPAVRRVSNVLGDKTLVLKLDS
jgi:glycine dehydrogenase